MLTQAIQTLTEARDRREGRATGAYDYGVIEGLRMALAVLEGLRDQSSVRPGVAWQGEDFLRKQKCNLISK